MGTMKVDMEIIQAKIEIIEQNLKLLKEMTKANYEKFKGNYRVTTKHALQESIESCLDIANHIITSLGYRRLKITATCSECWWKIKS